MQVSRFLVLISLLFLSISAGAQNASRDAIKAGFAYNLLTVEDAFVPMGYLEYTRVFFPPITIGVGANYSVADNITTATENRKLTTFAFDLMGYFSFFEDRKHDMKAGFMMSARSFLTEWENIDDETSGKDRLFHPGIGAILNYDYQISDSFLMGVKGSFTQYNNASSVFTFGGHVGVSF